MRREHNIVEQSYVDWLKSLGCVVYLPLTEGDLQDKISGNTLVVNNNRVTWDSSVGMYLFNAGSSSSSPAATLQTICDSNTFTDGVMTVLGNIQRGPATGTASGANCAYTENCKGTSGVFSANTGTWPTSLIQRATVLTTSPARRMWYQDLILEQDDAYTPTINDISTLTLVSYGGWSNTYATVYESDIMIFNRALDYDTIKLIQSSKFTYTDLQYIQSTGTQYIDTGYKPNSNTEIIYSCRQTESYVYGTNQTFFACSNGAWNNNPFVVGTYHNGAMVYGTGGNAGWGVFTTTVNEDTVFKLNSVGGYKDGIKVFDTSSYTLNQVTKNLTFCASNYTSITEYGKHRIYSAQIYESGNLVRNFIPKLRSDGKPGLYDTVNDLFYTNRGTGEFLYA